MCEPEQPPTLFKVIEQQIWTAVIPGTRLKLKASRPPPNRFGPPFTLCIRNHDVAATLTIVKNDVSTVHWWLLLCSV